jgi:hypothetical protein
VASNGLIEKVRTNLALQSQTLDNASWDKSDATVTANTTIAPDGTLTADTITAVVIDQRVNQSVAVSASTEHTFSFFAKKGTTITPRYSVYDLSNNAFILTQVDYSSLVNTSTWSRITATFTTPATCTLVSIYPINAASLGTTFIWGCQLETGVATDYIATTTAAVSVGPVSGLPRLDYLGSTCPKLLLEPQRTNLVKYSEQYNNAAWDKDGATITQNVAVAPDGTTSADKLVESATNAEHRVYQIVTGIGTVVQSMSVYAKAGERNWVALRFETGILAANFNLSTGVVGTVAAGATASIENAGNGWYKCKVSGLSNTSSNIMVINVGNADTGTGSGYSYLGNGTSGIFIWGAQLEVGSYATSYIPTLGASVTRVADIASKTGISSLIGQTEGTLFAEFTRLNVGNAVVIFQCNDGTTNNRAQLEIGATGIATTSVLSGGAVSCVITGATLALGQTHKLALTYKANDFKLYVNGVLAGTDTSGAVPISMSRIDLASELGTSFGGVSISQILNFTTALNNAQAIELTA